MTDHIEQMFETCQEVLGRAGVIFGARELHEAIFAAQKLCTNGNEYNMVMTAHNLIKQQLDALQPIPQNVEPVAELKKRWRQAYFTLLASEATAGRSEMDTDHLLMILNREILAGRIAKDDPAIVEIQQIQLAAMNPAPAPKKRNLFARMFA